MSFLPTSRAMFSSFSKRGYPSFLFHAENCCKFYVSTSGDQYLAEIKRKRPFHRFRNSVIEENKRKGVKMRFAEFSKILSVKWSQLDPNIKKLYAEEFENEVGKYKALLKKIPRRPPHSPFSYFVAEKRVNSLTSFKEISDEWKALSTEEKNLYFDKLEEAKERYKSDVITFNRKVSVEDLELLNHLAKDKLEKVENQRRKFLNFPKKPGSSSFSYFLSTAKDKYPKAENEETTKWVANMAVRWNRLTNDEKQKYVDERKQDFDKYKSEIEQWNLKYNYV